jgi:hypothetical protein
MSPKPLLRAALLLLIGASAVTAQQDGLPDPTVTVSAGDVRLGLLQAALHAGTTGHDAIIAAQTEGGEAIFLRSGSAGLADLMAALEDGTQPGSLRRAGDTFTAARPIVVMQGASLAIAPGETLRLDARGGAFVLSLGRIAVEGARIEAVGIDPADPLGFRPFVASLGTGDLVVRDGAIAGLGFPGAAMTSGLAHAARGLLRGPEPLTLTDVILDDVQGVTVLGGQGLDVSGSTFRDMRGTALSVSGAPETRIEANRFERGRGLHTIHVSGPDGQVRIARNVLSGGRHAGIRVSDGTAKLDLHGNRVSGYAGTAIRLDDGPACARVSGNLLEGNGGDGLAVRGGGPLAVDGNVIAGNGGAGISISQPEPRADMLVVHNLLAGNRTGLRGVMLGALRLAGNDFSDQRPRILSGDLAQTVPALLRASREGPVDLIVTHVVARPAPEALPADAADRAFARCLRPEPS